MPKCGVKAGVLNHCRSLDKLCMVEPWKIPRHWKNKHVLACQAETAAEYYVSKS